MSIKYFEQHLNDSKFEPIHSDPITVITQLLKRGIDIFGTIGDFNQWMNSKIVALCFIKPSEYLYSSFGILKLKS